MKKIVVIQPAGLTDVQLKELRKLGDVTYYNAGVKDTTEWLKRVKGAHIIYSNIQGFEEGWRDLRNVFVTLPFVGVGFLDPEVLKANSVIVSRSPGCNQVAVSEWIVGMLLNYTRQLASLTNTKSLDRPGPYYTTSLFSKKVCIVGKGHIGARTGCMLAGLGMDVDYYTREDNLTEKIKDADFIVDCLSFNPSTANFYNKDFFAKTKHGVVFVTITSKKMMDMKVILDHLASGKIKHFISDNSQGMLFDINDPDYLALVDNPNISITPHVSAYSDNTQETAARMCVENIKAYLDGKPINIVGE